MLFFRAALRPQRTSSLFDLVHSGEVTLCLSPDVLAEVRDVLTRPKLVAKYPALTTQAVDAFLGPQLRASKWFSIVPEHFVLQRDPKDSKYLNLAITAASSYLVTTDLDLLDLMEPTSLQGGEFRARFPAVRILVPAEFEAAIHKPFS
jgi:putative PIN family toxin of toxin-antitoxin system